MEDWQEWQLRADEVAAGLSSDVDALEATLAEAAEPAPNLRSFWPRFRDLKERVRTAPAIRLEAKLDLERRLRQLGSQAYRVQETVFARSGERRQQLVGEIGTIRQSAETESGARELRGLRRQLDQLRRSFDEGAPLAPVDRQTVWDAWRDANQFVWQKLVDVWNANEEHLREILATARKQIETGNANAARQSVSRFFEGLRDREAKQASIAEMKEEASEIRREAESIPEKSSGPRVKLRTAPTVPAVDTWRAEVARNGELIDRLRGEVAALDKEVQESTSVLEQAMVRGTLVSKRRKLDELEQANRSLQQKLDQADESPVLSGS